MKLYVWEDVLQDYTSGVMFALANSVEEARALVLAHTSYVPESDLAQEPKVYDAPVGFAVCGGG